MPQGYFPLAPEHKSLIDAVAATKPEKLPGFMSLCMMIGDYESCTYITAKHFDKLPPAVQTELRVSGLKTISDMTQDLVDGLYDKPTASGEQAAAPNVPASSSVH